MLGPKNVRPVKPNDSIKLPDVIARLHLTATFIQAISGLCYNANGNYIEPIPMLKSHQIGPMLETQFGIQPTATGHVPTATVPHWYLSTLTFRPDLQEAARNHV